MLGGDSIASITVSGRARRAGLPLSPRDVFTHRTPAALAEAVAGTQAGDGAPEGTGRGRATPTTRGGRETGRERT
nr:hypothetical protein GCM10020093_070530 [Planobispora longispora]